MSEKAVRIPWRLRGAAPLLNEAGISLIQVIIMAGLIGGLGVFFGSRSLIYRENQFRMATKTEVLNDQRIIKYELINRPFPAP